MRGRDTQRAKLYTAERIAFGDGNCASVGAARYPLDDPSIAGMQAYVDRVLADPRVLAAFPRAERPVRVESGTARRTRGCYSPAHPLRRGAGKTADVIKMPVWTRSTWYLLHEVAHHLTWDLSDVTRAAHGPEFVDCYLDLLGWFAPDLRPLLLVGLARQRVRHTRHGVQAVTPQVDTRMTYHEFMLAAGVEAPDAPLSGRVRRPLTDLRVGHRIRMGGPDWRTVTDIVRGPNGQVTVMFGDGEPVTVSATRARQDWTFIA